MIKLAITFSEKCFPHQKLSCKICRHFISIGGIGRNPIRTGVSLPSVSHNSPDIFLDDAGRNGGVQIGRIVVPEILAPTAIGIPGVNTYAGFNTVQNAPSETVLGVYAGFA